MTSESLPSNSAGGGRARTARIRLGEVVTAESGNYFLLLGTTLFLVLLGLVMVLSSSSIDSYTARQGFFGVFWKQGLFALIGIPLMLVVSRIPTRFWKRWAWVGLAVALAVQMLVFTPLGDEVGGNLNWVAIGGYTFQPSELVKLALVIWLGTIMAKKEALLSRWGHLVIPVFPVTALALGLVLIGGDLGTVMIMAGLVLGGLFFAGVKLRMLAVPILVGATVAVVVAFSSQSRSDRIFSFLSGTNADYQGVDWQTQHGEWALAGGNVFGVGLGNSKAKWSWLPAADNDYIFAIIGEELGLVGAVVVLLLFVALAIAFVRIIRSTHDMFARVVTGAVMVWLIGQAFVNIAVVLGLLPVLGVPLPLISSGGSALLTTLAAIGIVLSIAREVGRDTRVGLEA
ncbi:putative lipid II flippase FtsW [Humibacter sp. BT305]|uniref:putative lipid II flippase FtsW n=1 Tax=Cnuibacter physcomitrellae TaxID=1619308 RepID=UPI000E0B940B|nr:putative lipid II flippase FtsW [Cnuibacter physcomitrellae]AXH36205.1 putative lipid II flippase FtsW [Humibacter sp. BT305]MCS5498682.1 putative lipid II flippase FtsW [Cnuibacter physcomitrellae]